MSFVSRRPGAALAHLAAVAATILIPSTAPFAAERLLAQPLAAELLPAAALPAADATAAVARAGLLAALLADDTVTTPFSAETGADAGDRAAVAGLAVAEEDLVCLAKAVRHEAGGQARDGQLAVAQLIVNRLRSGRFAGTVCGVVNQQGQFFRTAGYNPDRSSAVWANAMAVAQEALAGETPGVAPGALFFHAAFQPPSGFFRTRQRVASLGGNVFYR